MLWILILDSKGLKWEEPRAFVKMSASWCWEETWKVRRTHDWIFSRTTWQSMSMCLIRSWKTWLAAMWRESYCHNKGEQFVGEFAGRGEEFETTQPHSRWTPLLYTQPQQKIRRPWFVSWISKKSKNYQEKCSSPWLIV